MSLGYRIRPTTLGEPQANDTKKVQAKGVGACAVTVLFKVQDHAQAKGTGVAMSREGSSRHVFGGARALRSCF